MAVSGFGKAKYSSGGGWDRFKLKEGNNIFRILPPMKSGVPGGIWARYIGVHYGYVGVDNKDPSKTRHRPFACIKDTNFKTKMVIQECPECQNIEHREKEVKRLESQAQVEQWDGQRTKMTIAPLKEWLKEHNCDRKWYLNVKTPEGKFGVLMISHKGCKTQLDQQIAEVRDTHKFDPLSLEKGVWFNFHRTGMDLSTTYAIKPVMVFVEANGKRYQELKIDEMSDAEQEQALETCPDLSEVARAATFDQIRALVGGSGDPHEVDAILGVSQSRGRDEQGPGQTIAVDEDEPSSPVDSSGPAPSPVASAPSAARTPAPVVAEDDEEAALMAKLAEARAKKAAAAAVTVSNVVPMTKAEKPVFSTNGPGRLSDEDFLKQFGG